MDRLESEAKTSTDLHLKSSKVGKQKLAECVTLDDLNENGKT